MSHRQLFVNRLARFGLRRIIERVSPAQARLDQKLRCHFRLYGPARVFVVGAAGGLGSRYWPWVRRHLVYAGGFEPEKEAYDRLITSRSQNVHWYPFALGHENGETSLFITANPRCSSCLEPDMEVLSAYPVAEWFSVRSKRQIRISRLDSLYEAGEIEHLPDFLHIDVQGFEFQVLTGLGRYIERITCLEVEAQFKRLYKGQRVFAELKDYLEAKGFFLRQIESQGWFNGEVVELNAYFCRRNDNLDERQKSLIHLWERICGLEPYPLFTP